jgi:hypothetical protein
MHIQFIRVDILSKALYEFSVILNYCRDFRGPYFFS